MAPRITSPTNSLPSPTPASLSFSQLTLGLPDWVLTISKASSDIEVYLFLSGDMCDRFRVPNPLPLYALAQNMLLMLCVLLVLADHFDIFVEAPSQVATLANADYEVLVAKDRGPHQFPMAIYSHMRPEERLVRNFHGCAELWLIPRWVDDICYGCGLVPKVCNVFPTEEDLLVVPGEPKLDLIRLELPLVCCGSY